MIKENSREESTSVATITMTAMRILIVTIVLTLIDRSRWFSKYLKCKGSSLKAKFEITI